MELKCQKIIIETCFSIYLRHFITHKSLRLYFKKMNELISGVYE